MESTTTTTEKPRVLPKTLKQVDWVCESVGKIPETPGEVIGDLFFFGYYKPLEIAHNDVIINKSSINGLTVVATKEIPAGVVVTHHPVHAIGWAHTIRLCRGEEKDEILCDKVTRYAVTHSRYISLRRVEEEEEEKKKEEDKTPIGALIIGNPNNTSNPLLLGHVIRDAVGNPFKGTSFVDIRQWITFKNKVAMYYIQGMKLINCRYMTNSAHTLVSIESIKPIKEGEELLLLKGAEYWYHRQYDREDTDMLGNMMFEMLMEDAQFGRWLRELYNKNDEK